MLGEATRSRTRHPELTPRAGGSYSPQRDRAGTRVDRDHPVHRPRRLDRPHATPGRRAGPARLRAPPPHADGHARRERRRGAPVARRRSDGGLRVARGRGPLRGRDAAGGGAADRRRAPARARRPQRRRDHARRRRRLLRHAGRHRTPALRPGAGRTDPLREHRGGAPRRSPRVPLPRPRTAGNEGPHRPGRRRRGRVRGGGADGAPGDHSVRRPGRGDGEIVGLLHRACAGEGALVMVVGEPGIGKTRTAEELAELARRDGARVLPGRCYEGEWAPPYGPFVEAIEAYARAVTAEELRADLGYGAPPLARLIPSLRERLPGIAEPAPLPADEERFRLLDAVSQLLIAASERAPILLVLDDLHWADRDTIAMLRHVARAVARHRMLVLGLYRDVELDGQHALADALGARRREAPYARVALKGLDVAGVGALLEAMAQHEPNPALVRAISDETDGNPFFIREVLIHLVEEGKLYGDGGRCNSRVTSIGDLGIPEGVREVITCRVSRLADVGSGFLF